jgi:hypothetical protein
VSRCISRPTRFSSGTSARRRSGSVRAATHSLQRGDEQRAGERRGEHVDHPVQPLLSMVRQHIRLGTQLGRPALGEVPDGGQHEIVLGRVVMQLRPSGCPARSAISVVVVPAQPRPTRHSTVAPAAGPAARLRSC